MKNIYDKLLLGLGLLALLVGVGIFFMLKSSATAAAQPLTDAQLLGEQFEPVETPEISAPSRIWEEPETQSTDWLFYVFTPPQIYYNPETQELTRDPVYDADSIPQLPFGLELIALEQQTYRLIFRASYGETPTSPLSIEDTSTGKYIGPGELVKAGNTYQDARVRIDKFEVVKKADPRHGDIVRTPTVTVFDLDLGKSFVLKQGEKIVLEGEQSIVFQPLDYENQPTGSKISLSQVGESFTHMGATFTLKQINFDKQLVVVEKESPLLDEPRSKELTVEKPEPKQTRNKTPANTPKSNSQPAKQPDPFQNIFK